MHSTVSRLLVAELALTDAELHIARKALKHSPKPEDVRVQSLLEALDAEATRREPVEAQTVRRHGGMVRTQVTKNTRLFGTE